MVTNNVSLRTKKILSSNINIDHDNWKSIKYQALTNTVNQINDTKNNFSEVDRKKISDTVLSIQSKINNNTLCVEDIEKYAVELREIGMASDNINKFLQDIILMAKHKSGINSIVSSFGISYKTSAIKDFIKSFENKTRYFSEEQVVAGLSDIVASLITSAVGKVTADKELSQKSFESLKKQLDNDSYTGYKDDANYILDNYIPHVANDPIAENMVFELIKKNMAREETDIPNKYYQKLINFTNKKINELEQGKLYNDACRALQSTSDLNELSNFIKFAFAESKDIVYAPHSQAAKTLKRMFLKLDPGHQQLLIDSVDKRLMELVLSRITIGESNLNDCLNELQEDIQTSTRSNTPIKLYAIPSDENSSILGLAANMGSPNLAPKKVAMFTFCGTFENHEDSESIHVDLYNRAQLDDRNKKIYDGPGSGKNSSVTDIIKGGFTGQEVDNGVDSNIEKALADAEEMHKHGVNKFFISGWSRGGVTGRIFSNMLKEKFPDVEVIACLDDPVPGGINYEKFSDRTGFASKYKDYLHQDCGVKGRVFYAETEISVGFSPIIINDENIDKISLPLNHKLIVGLELGSVRERLGNYGRGYKLRADTTAQSHKIVRSDRLKWAIALGIPFKVDNKCPGIIFTKSYSKLISTDKRDPKVQDTVNQATVPFLGNSTLSTLYSHRSPSELNSGELI